MLNTVQNGKGSKPRPVDKKKFDENFDAITWGKNKKPKKIKEEKKTKK